ncbi:MAG: nucleotidyltransferase family protein [Lachnospiraceae bacterium]|nr:nucleotidyltransferase family protein [Lachnospiraceae bacterium]
MDDRLRQLISLLRSHLLRVDVKPLFPVLSDIEWSELYELALSHGVQGFAYEGAFFSNIPIPPTLREIWRQRMICDVRKYYSIQRECFRVICNLKNNDIKPVILKGLSVSQAYPYPELRVMGDIDILVHNRFFEAALCLEEMGYRAKKEVAVHHIEFKKKNFLVELHRIPFTPTGVKNYDNLIKAVSFTGEEHKYIKVTDAEIPVLTDEDFINESIEHILKHLTHDRMALRNVCDILMLFVTYQRNSWIDYYDLIEKNGMGEQFSGIVSLLVYEFGLSEELVSGIKLLEPKDEQKFAENVFSILSAHKGANKYYSSLSVRGAFRMLFNYLNAVRRDILIKYPYCRENILLRPIAFIHAYFDYLVELMRKMIGRFA